MNHTVYDRSVLNVEQIITRPYQLICFLSYKYLIEIVRSNTVKGKIAADRENCVSNATMRIAALYKYTRGVVAQRLVGVALPFLVSIIHDSGCASTKASVLSAEHIIIPTSSPRPPLIACCWSQKHVRAIKAQVFFISRCRAVSQHSFVVFF